MLKEIPEVPVSYEVITGNSDPGEAVIRKLGMVSEFTLNEIDRDIQLLNKKKDELESQLKVEEARLINIERDRPEIAKMDEDERKIVFIYARSFAFAKECREKLAEIDAQVKEYRAEVMKIAIETGLGKQAADQTAKVGEGENDNQNAGEPGKSEGGGN